MGLTVPGVSSIYVTIMITYMPTLFIPHGGGPCFFMEQDFGPAGCWEPMRHHLANLSQFVPQHPTAIVMISGHWEEAQVTLQTAAQPGMLYDYYGFPPETYHLQYPAPGSPALAAEIQRLLEASHIPVAQDDQRGFDHGTFIPLMLAYPQADIPVVQISLRRDLDPAFHRQLGLALAPLRQQGGLLIGSGMSFHNLRTFFSDHPAINAEAVMFDQWLNETVTGPDPLQCRRELELWAKAPGAKASHPRAEHLLPLMVVAGAAPDCLGRNIFTTTIGGKPVSSFGFW